MLDLIFDILLVVLTAVSLAYMLGIDPWSWKDKCWRWFRGIGRVKVSGMTKSFIHKVTAEVLAKQHWLAYADPKGCPWSALSAYKQEVLIEKSREYLDTIKLIEGSSGEQPTE